MRHALALVAGIAAVAGLAPITAEELPGTSGTTPGGAGRTLTTPGGSGSSAGSGSGLAGAPVTPGGTFGRPLGAGSPSPMLPGLPGVGGTGRQVTVQGLIDLDYLSGDNATDLDGDRADHINTGIIRAELGMKLELGERIAVVTTLAYDSFTGHGTWTRRGYSDPENPDQGDAQVVLDDAYIVLKEFLDQPQIGLTAGRFPESWNLRRDRPAFLYDSRADDPDVTSWDGAHLRWMPESLIVHAYAYDLPDESSMFGAALDWQPQEASARGLFVTLSANLERNARTGTVFAPGPRTGSMYTYYGGLEMRFDSGIDLWVEGALQNGELEDDRELGGWGVSGGIEVRLSTVNQMLFGVQVDHLSGDDDPTDGKYRALVNNWEGISDTLIVEDEKYGEMSAYVAGGIQALKGRAEIALDRLNRFRVEAVVGHYRATEPLGGEREIGNEFDLGLRWQFTSYTDATLSLRGGILLPGEALQNAVGSGDNDDMVHLFVANLLVAF